MKRKKRAWPDSQTKRRLAMAKQRRATKNLKVWGHPDGAQFSAYASWIRLRGCQIKGMKCVTSRAIVCEGPAELDHWTTRGAGGGVEGLWCLCRSHHRQRHDSGVATFQAMYGIDAQAIVDKNWRDGGKLVEEFLT